ncbi:MAG: hypothetical protein AB1455_06510, partial [Pseudomonadota bacterium]
TNSSNRVHEGSPSAWGLRLTFHKVNLGTVVPSPGSGKSLRIQIKEELIRELHLKKKKGFFARLFGSDD